MPFDKLSSIARFKASCPFLGRTKTSTLRSLCTSASARYPSLSQLSERAASCPVMGPALAVRSNQLAGSHRGYASVAGAADIQGIHAREGIFPASHPNVPSNGAGIEKCPHAAAARRAAEIAQALAEAKEKKATAAVDYSSTEASSSHVNGFNYESFYAEELDKKHKDKSYRYFNNINRLAAKFPVAHTGSVEEEVTVWCANDYLGMGKNPVVLDTIQ